MSVRNSMFGLVTLLGIAGAAVAAPPVNPLVEGRETGPVAREFYEPETTTFGYVAEEESSIDEARGAGWWASHAMREMLLNRLTIPLESVQLWD